MLWLLMITIWPYSGVNKFSDTPDNTSRKIFRKKKISTQVQWSRVHLKTNLLRYWKSRSATRSAYLSNLIVDNKNNPKFVFKNFFKIILNLYLKKIKNNPKFVFNAVAKLTKNLKSCKKKNAINMQQKWHHELFHWQNCLKISCKKNLTIYL